MSRGKGQRLCSILMTLCSFRRRYQPDLDSRPCALPVVPSSLRHRGGDESPSLLQVPIRTWRRLGVGGSTQWEEGVFGARTSTVAMAAMAKGTARTAK